MDCVCVFFFQQNARLNTSKKEKKCPLQTFVFSPWNCFSRPTTHAIPRPFLLLVAIWATAVCIVACAGEYLQKQIFLTPSFPHRELQ